jgi:hypothetical protein
MIATETDVESPGDVPMATSESHREGVERVSVRRRRRSRSRRHRSGTWTARASRRKAVRAFVVCAGVLILMALGLYFGLQRQNTAPAETSLEAPAKVLHGVLA